MRPENCIQMQPAKKGYYERNGDGYQITNSLFTVAVHEFGHSVYDHLIYTCDNIWCQKSFFHIAVQKLLNDHSS